MTQDRYSPLPSNVMTMKLYLLSMVIVGFLATVIEPLHAANAKTPNILFFFADDWGRYASIYGQVNGRGGINDIVRTPNFDKVAKQGVLFRNAHVNAP
ncbi:MAG: hypothetical protein ABL921_33265, partial [Pirellula sp.]